MRDLVTRRSYLWRKKLDDFLFWAIPIVWVPLYNSVTFTDMGYSSCISNRKWQDKVNNPSITLFNGQETALIPSSAS